MALPRTTVFPMRPPVVVAAYLLAELCLLIRLAVLGSTSRGRALAAGTAPARLAVVDLGVACIVLASRRCSRADCRFGH